MVVEAIRLSTDIRNNSESGRIPHNCGIVGVFAPGEDVAGITVKSLSHLNHRGQEGVGIMGRSLDGRTKVIKGDGLVKSVFPEEKIEELRAINPDISVGHDRYSTSGGPKAWQPFVDHESGFSLAHNGNLTNAIQLLERLSDDEKERAVSDTWIAHRTIVSADGETWEEKIANGLDKMEGAYSLIMQQGEKLYAARDPWGMRPLVVGRLPGGGYIVASETSAFTPLGATHLREIERGERIVIGKNAETGEIEMKTFSTDERANEVSRKKCPFEDVYNKAPDSRENGRFVSEIRYELGRTLARRDAAEGFLPERVVGVQESGVLYAEAYFEEMLIQIRTNPRQFGLKGKIEIDSALNSLQMVTGLVKNPYSVLRAFMDPDVANRGKKTLEKHRVNPGDIENKKVVVVDDSEVRGTTAELIINALRTVGPVTYGMSGPSEVHMRIGSPVITDPCFWGVDFATHAELASRRNSEVGATREEMIEGMRKASGADSLKFITHEEFIKALTTHPVKEGETSEDLYSENGFCGHCFTGVKPMEVQGVFAKPEKVERSLNGKGNGHLREGQEAILSGQYIAIDAMPLEEEAVVAGMFNPLELE